MWGAILGAAACGDEKAKDDYLKKAKKSEAELHLTSISKSAKSYYVERAEFPAGNAPLTPATSCCQHVDKKCPPDARQWQDVMLWNELDFSVDDPHYFRYSYQGDGKTFVARAVGDLDCDGIEVTWEMRGEVVDGTPTSTLVKPTRPD